MLNIVWICAVHCTEGRMDLGDISFKKIYFSYITYSSSYCIFPNFLLAAPRQYIIELGKFGTATSNSDVHTKGDDSF